MATLQSRNAPASRTEAGNHVLDAAESLGAAATKPVASRLATFKKAHGAYVSADGVVKTSDAAVRAQQAKVGEADVVQDDCVDDLAAALAGEGLPRLAPFKPFKFEQPAAIKKMGYTSEAAMVLRLSAAVQQRTPPLPKSRKTAAALTSAAKAVLAAAAPIEKLSEKRRTAMSKRDALEQTWETAFASLKRGARAAEDDGATGLFDALFGSGPKKAKPTKKSPDAKKSKRSQSGDAASDKTQAPT